MRKLIKFSIFGLAAMFMTACGGQTEKKEETKSGTKSLILYYSQTGVTKTVAEELSRKVTADIESIEVENPYEEDFDATVARVIKERENSELPIVKDLKHDLAVYDTIYLGYPVWFGTFAPPVIALLKNTDLSGKTVVPFCTFGSGGLCETMKDLKDAQPNANILSGYGVREARIEAMPSELDKYLIKMGIINGDPVSEPDFSESQPVTDTEKEIFNAACADYKFPLGTPVSFSKRTIGDVTEYKFTTNAVGKDGNETQFVIFVNTENGKKPEFTIVNR